MRKTASMLICAFIMGLFLALASSCSKDDAPDTQETIKDVDGNKYKIVTIGTQIWMAENLKTTKFNDGEDIPLITSNDTWAALTIAGYCWYNNDEATYKATYGALYNWFTVSTGKLCPAGWHVPTNLDWDTLLEATEGGMIKETGTTHWISPNAGATNKFGFTALPGGYRSGKGGDFFGIGEKAYWWSGNKMICYTNHSDNIIGLKWLFNNTEQYGQSIRCVKD